MGPEQGSAYDREMATMAAGASPGIIRGIMPPLSTFGVPPPPGTPAPNVPKPSLVEQIDDLADQVSSSAHAVAQWRQNASAANQNLAEAEKIFADLAARLSAAMHEHREGTPEGVPYQP